ncbi:MAG: T9SS type A sorting domain-containing protein [Flavobacteriales bacterium]|nr:T9SS type A sorting domain-containing protein [Flavobacteriales bacterium]
MTTLALAMMATAQTNLVLNGSFEDTVFCSTPTQCTLLKAVGWYNPNTATPDVWDCDLDRICGSAMYPTGPNAPYFQLSHEGDRHAGIYLMLTPNGSTREYLMTRLSAPMVAGAGYEVSLWQVRRRWRYAIDHIGVWFGQDSLFEATPNWLSVTPQMRLRHPESPYLLEGFVWEQLADTFVAQGGEQWMVIGNFDPLGTVDYIDLSPGGSPVSYAYHFIDQVAVRPIEKGTGIAPAQLQTHWQGDGWWLRWPPDLRPDRVRLFDAAGRLVYEERITAHGGTLRLSWPNGSQGIYLVVLTGTGLKLTARVAAMGR